MSSEPKKISFGFTKVLKKQDLAKPVQNNVELIDCIESQTIKVIGENVKQESKAPLVIPLKRPEKPGKESNLVSIIKEETGELEDDTPVVSEQNVSDENSKSKLEDAVNLDKLAAKEILEDLHKTETLVKKVFNVPMPKEPALVGEKESSLEDYDNIPIADFGLAMLRGMGWEESKGIGKNERQVKVAVPELRPKGLGLGADRPNTKANKDKNKTNVKEDLQIKKGAYVKIIMGKNVNAYGQIEGLDDDAGRLFVKMVLGGDKLSLNEFMVEPVTKAEYDKNGRVLNSRKYEEYKNKEKDNNGDIGNTKIDHGTKCMSNESSSLEERTQKNIRTVEKERYHSSNKYEAKHTKSSYIHSEKMKESSSYRKSHRKEKKRHYSSEDSTSSDSDTGSNRDKRRNRSLERTRPAHRNQEKYSDTQRSSKNHDKYDNSRYRHR